MDLVKNYFRQTRKPEGFLGRLMLGTMHSGHAQLADWGFLHSSPRCAGWITP